MTNTQLAEFIIEVIAAGTGSICFSVLFCTPSKFYLPCGLAGALGWSVYYIVMLIQPSVAIATLIAAIPLVILARIFSVCLKAPVTIFLVGGIFPLVPGAGIYRTVYYFIQGNNPLFVANGVETLKVACALALGISIVLGIPNGAFSWVNGTGFFWHKLKKKRRINKKDGL